MRDPVLLDRARRAWNERYQLLDALDRLPQTLVHGDADRRNLFARRDRDGEDETVAIGWAWMGIAALGDDLVDLAAGSALWFQADPRDLPTLAEACLAGYGAGLADAGWPGDARLACIGFAIGAVLHYGPCGPFVFRLRYPEMAETLARAEGRDPYETADRLAAVQRFALDRLDAVRDDIAAL